MSFIVSTLILFTILTTKLFFMFVGKGIVPTKFEYISVGILITVLVGGFVSFLKNKRKDFVNEEKKENKTFVRVFIIFSALLVLFSLFVNFNKKAVLWDAVALYDARAQFLRQEVSFFDMVDLSKYDPQNSYYYVLYPPHTSILHYFWYDFGLTVPVSIIYSLFLLVTGVSIFAISRRYLSLLASSILTLLTVSNGVIFTSSLTEYTNLPFTLQVLLGAFLINEYLSDNAKWKLYYGVGLLVTSMWIRFLEPIWLAAGLAFLIITIVKKKFGKNLVWPVLLLVYGVLEYVSWQGFVSGFGSVTTIVEFSYNRLLEPLVGIFTGPGFNIFAFFIKSWGPILFIHLFAIWIYISRKELNFLPLFLLFSILIYFGGLYFVSFQSDWWVALGDSLVRSSAFMVPISSFIILKYLNEEKN